MFAFELFAFSSIFSMHFCSDFSLLVKMSAVFPSLLAISSSHSLFASGIDAIEYLLKLLYLRERGDIKFDFLYGDDELDVAVCCKTRRFMNDLGEELKSRIFIGDSCFNFNCSTADGFVVNFLLVAFKRSRLKSFKEVFGTPRRSLHVVVCALFVALLNVTCDIVVLLPKLLSFAPTFDGASFSLAFFNGVDVLNVVFVFGGVFFALNVIGKNNFRLRRFDFRLDSLI